MGNHCSPKGLTVVICLFAIFVIFHFGFERQDLDSDCVGSWSLLTFLLNQLNHDLQFILFTKQECMAFSLKY